MDKKTLFFVFCVTLSFLVINTFFTKRYEKEKLEWKEKQQELELKKEKESPKTLVTAPKEEKKYEVTKQDQEENLFVLENDYQQLVFSNRGGSLVEVNLPFSTEKNEKSIVKEIKVDSYLKENEPQNSYFPAKSFYTPDNGKLKKNEQGTLGGYYPLIRRSLKTKNGKSLIVSPEHYSLNIVSEYPELASLIYEVKSFDEKSIVFESTQSYRRITKTFSIKDGDSAPYCMSVKIKIDGDKRGLWLTSGIPEAEILSGANTSLLKYRIIRQGKSEIEKISPPKDQISMRHVHPYWVSNANGFFGLILDPQQDVKGYKIENISAKAAPTRLMLDESATIRGKNRNFPGYNLMLPITEALGSSDEIEFIYYAGPFSEEILKRSSAFYKSVRDDDPEYGEALTFLGWFSFISAPFAKFLLIFLKFFHKLTNSWAFSIILLTMLLRLLLFPLNSWSMKSARRMQKIAPKVAAIQAKHKKTPKKAQVEILNLYRKEKANPFTGCLPIIIQMPFLIGMFDLLKSSFPLRGAPFIPGWIDNLTAPDVLFSWSQSIFLIGNELHLLPILLGAVMFLQQKISSSMPKDKKLMTDQQKQQKMMGRIMVVFFTIMFYNFPAGLNIYWLSSMMLGVLQQWFINKQLDKKSNSDIIEPKIKKVRGTA